MQIEIFKCFVIKQFLAIKEIFLPKPLLSIFSNLSGDSGVRRKKLRGVRDYGRPRRGFGGGPPLTQENFRKFAKNSWRKLQKMLYFRLFCKNILKPCVKFWRVWTKNTIVWGNFEKILKILDENSMEKLNFYLVFGNFVAKNRNFGNNIIFLQQSFPVRGVWTPP